MKKTIDYKDINGFYRDEGKGQAVILLHGFCEDSKVWDGFIGKLKSKLRVIAPDLPGYGNTSLTIEELTVEWMADFVKAIIQKEKLKKITLIGHSMGGYVALAFAEKYPELLDKMALFHSHAYADYKEKIKNRKKAIASIRKYGTLPFVNELYNMLFAEKFRKGNKDLISKLKKNAGQYTQESLIASTYAMIKRPDRTHVLKNFQAPVLFILGKEDKAIPYQKTLEQTHLPEVSVVHILEEVGHMGMIEAERKTCDFIREFINLKV